MTYEEAKDYISKLTYQEKLALCILLEQINQDKNKEMQVAHNG